MDGVNGIERMHGARGATGARRKGRACGETKLRTYEIPEYVVPFNVVRIYGFGTS